MKEKNCFRSNINEPSILFPGDDILKSDCLKIQILTGRIFWVKSSVYFHFYCV